MLVNPSHTESAPNVVLQAMSCAVPCVVTDVGDSARFVGATGWVCDAQRASLADALSEALDTAPEARNRLGAQARARVVEHYDLAASVEAYAVLYRALAGSVAGECA